VRPFQIAPYGAIGSAGILADINLDPENQPPLFTPCLPVGSRRYMQWLSHAVSATSPQPVGEKKRQGSPAVLLYRQFQYS